MNEDRDDAIPSLNDHPRIGDPFIVHCSITPEDELGLQVIGHTESDERRVIIECAETMEDEPESIYEALATGTLHAKVVLTAQTARMFAARLLDAADLCDGNSAGNLARSFDDELKGLLGE